MAVKNDNWLSGVGERLREARLVSGVKTEKLIERVAELGGGVSSGTISNWENGRTAAPRADYLLVVCEASGLSPGYVLTGERPREWIRTNGDEAATNAVEALAEEVMKRLREREAP